MNIQKINMIVRKAKSDIDLSGQTSTKFVISDEFKLHVFHLPQEANPKLICLRGIIALNDDKKLLNSLIKTNYASTELIRNDAEPDRYIFTIHPDSGHSPVVNCALYCGVNWIEIPLSFLIETLSCEVDAKGYSHFPFLPRSAGGFHSNPSYEALPKGQPVLTLSGPSRQREASGGTNEIGTVSLAKFVNL